MLGVVVLRDEVARLKVWGRRMINYRTGEVLVLGENRSALMQWLVANYGMQVQLHSVIPWRPEVHAPSLSMYSLVRMFPYRLQNKLGALLAGVPVKGTW